MSKKQFFGKWKKDKETGVLIWKWKRRRIRASQMEVPLIDNEDTA